MPGEIELKPCPFCGARLVYVDEMMGFWEHPRSADCILAARVVDLEAGEMWNCRAADGVVVAEQPPTPPAVNAVYPGTGPVVVGGTSGVA